MPGHDRHIVASQNTYPDHSSTSLSSSSMYSRPRIAVSDNYLAVPSSSRAPDVLYQQPAHQSTTYDNYPSTSAPAVSLPPQHRPSSGAWSLQDDQQLAAARMQGLNWGQIHAAYFPSKSPNACRKRHERLLERKGADDWGTRKLQRLAKEYMGMRKEIWSGLASKTGDKWNVVEQKCMSNGLKNLQSAARAASRRDRLEGGTSLTGYDDDSGISGITLTPVDELDASYSSPETSASSGGRLHSASSSTASGSANFHHRMQSQPQSHLQPLCAVSAYDLTPYGASYGTGGSINQHAYSSSASSSTSTSQGYASQAGLDPGSGTSSYMDRQRMPSLDMGIDAIINRPRGRPT